MLGDMRVHYEVDPERKTHDQLVIAATKQWEYSVLIDQTWVDTWVDQREAALDLHSENALYSLKKAAIGFRYPTLQQPVYVYFAHSNRVFKLTPHGETDRDRWRSMVVQLRNEIQKTDLRQRDNYMVQYLSTLYVWDLCYGMATLP